MGPLLMLLIDNGVNFPSSLNLSYGWELRHLKHTLKLYW